MFQRGILYCLLYFFCNLAAGQLSGIYSVGKYNDDFPTLDSAINALHLFGQNSDVHLLLSDTIFTEIHLNNIDPGSGNYLYIEKNPALSEKSKFTLGTITNCKQLVLRDLYFIPHPTIKNISLLKITSGKDIQLINCTIADLISDNFGNDNGVLVVTNVGSDPSFVITLDSCNIEVNKGVNAVGMTLRYGRAVFKNSKFTGNWYSFSSTDINFLNCYFSTTNDIDFSGIGYFKNCYFDFTKSNNSINLEAKYISHCELTGTVNAGFKTTRADHCIFNINVSLSFSNNTILEDNIFRKSLKVSFGDNMIYQRNVFHDAVQLSFADEVKMFNNFFLNNLRISFGTIKIFNNSFGPKSHFEYNGEGSVFNNLLNTFSGSIPPKGFWGNNFGSTEPQTLRISVFDKTPSYFNPKYKSPEDLHIQNFSLIGLNELVTGVFEDIDLNTRTTYSCPGADEICLGLPLPDSVFVRCGMDYLLNLCGQFSKYHWHSDSAIVDSNSRIRIFKKTHVLLKDSLGKSVDTLVLYPVPALKLNSRTQTVTCGQYGELYTIALPGAKVRWEPDSFLMHNDTPYTYIFPRDNITYIAAIDEGLCGIRHDTVNIYSETKPQASFLYDSIDCKKGYFFVYQTCYDSIHWDFGDGTRDTGMKVWHTFPENGMYAISCFVWHRGILDKFSRFVTIGCTGMQDIYKSEYRIYPNPANHIINIEISDNTSDPEYKIFNSSAQLVLAGRSSNKQIRVDVSVLKSGVYFVKVGDTIRYFIKNE